MESNMTIRKNVGLLAPMLLAGLAILAGGCASTKEANVTLEELSPPAKATVQKVTAGGRVDKVTKEVERGKKVYDVEATVGGKHLEFLIGEEDGAVLGTEVPIEFNQLPAPVRESAEKYFGTSSGLTVMKGVEFGETQYEIEGMKDGKRVEITYDADGKKGH
jgi:uncharacterized membrane protein YkoI